MRKQLLKSQIVNIVSTTAVLLTLFIISLIQYKWLISSAEKDITELYRNLTFTLYRSISYELKDNFFLVNGLDQLEYFGDISNFKNQIDQVDDNYINSIGFLSPSNDLYSLQNSEWTVLSNIDINPKDIGIFIPDRHNKGIVKFFFKPKGSENAVVYLYFDLLSFYTDKIEDGLDPVLLEYDIEWFFSLPENSVVLNERSYSFSPLRSIKNIIRTDKFTWLIGINFFMELEKTKRFKNSPIMIGPLNMKRFQKESSLYVNIKLNGKSIIESKEEALTKQWLLTLLLLMGLGTSYILILNQIRKLKNLRSREKEFVATVTHELRTPLAVIDSAADNMQKGIIDINRIKTYGTLIRSHSKRLSSLIEGILLFSRFEGKTEQSPILKEILTSDLIANINYISEMIQKDYNVEVISKINLPEIFISDRESIELILSNLMINSAKHAYDISTKGKIRINSHIKMPNNIIFTVEDDGFGINKKEKRHIFEPFFRGERSHTEQINGTGLGLFLISKKAKLIGGVIQLSSPYERSNNKLLAGCKFTITIPYNTTEKVGTNV